MLYTEETFCGAQRGTDQSFEYYRLVTNSFYRVGCWKGEGEKVVVEKCFDGYSVVCGPFGLNGMEVFLMELVFS